MIALAVLLQWILDAAASASRQSNTLADPTDWPSWLSAIGTVGAFFLALYLLGVQIYDRRREARMTQARLVAAWVANIAERENTDPSAVYAITVHARNGSTEPVYNVVVTTDVGVRGTFVRNPNVLGPGETREFVIMAPGEPRGQPLGMVVRDRFLLEDGSGRILLEDDSGVLWLENYVPAVSISFVDSAGRHWMRQPKGKLRNPSPSSASD